MTLRITMLGIGFALLLILSGCGSDNTSSTPPATSNPVDPGAPAVANTTVTTTDGETINVKVTEDGFVFEGYEGKIVLLEVYGNTCPHCIGAVPAYNAIQNKYKNDVLVISIESYGQPAADLKNGLAAQMQYRTIAKADSGTMIAHIQSFVGNPGGVPYLLVLNRAGAVTDFVPPMDFTFDLLESKVIPLL